MPRQHRVSQRVGARQKPHRPAAKPGYVIHGSLDHLVILADQIGLVRPNGNRQPLAPVRFVPPVAIGGPWIGHVRKLAGAAFAIAALAGIAAARMRTSRRRKLNGFMAASRTKMPGRGSVAATKAASPPLPIILMTLD